MFAHEEQREGTGISLSLSLRATCGSACLGLRNAKGRRKGSELFVRLQCYLFRSVFAVPMLTGALWPQRDGSFICLLGCVARVHDSHTKVNRLRRTEKAAKFVNLISQMSTRPKTLPPPHRRTRHFLSPGESPDRENPFLFFPSVDIEYPRVSMHPGTRAIDPPQCSR